MKLLSLVVLLAGLSVWELDESCEPHRDAIQKAYDDAEYMAVKAQEDLLTILDPRPACSKGTAEKARNWDRIARAVTNMSGFVPNKDGSKVDNEYYFNLMCRFVPYLFQTLYWLDCETNISEDVFHRMTTTLREGKMVPENGYGGLKPLKLCGMEKFTWVGADDTDLKDPEKRPPKVSRSKDIVAGHVGAWTYKDRYVGARKEGNAVSLCNPGEWAITNTRLGFMIICPQSFDNDVAQTPSAVDVKDDEMTKDDTLDKYGSKSLSRTLIHELTHWFGGAGTGGMSNRNGKLHSAPFTHSTWYMSFLANDSFPSLKFPIITV
jgi:hypothetical protein